VWPVARVVRGWAAAGAVALQLAVLYWPRPPSVPSGGLPLDKVAHVVVFALPVVALVAAGAARRWVLAVLVGHAVASELVQHALLARRSGDPADVAADLIGVALGALLARRPRAGGPSGGHGEPLGPSAPAAGEVARDHGRERTG
jgi:hypothetical protein